MLFDVYDKCADALENGQVDVVTTDNVILLGFVAESDGDFKLVGEQFTEEPYGIGIKKGDVEFCEFINETLADNEDAYNDGVGGHRREDRGHPGARAARGRTPAPDRAMTQTVGRSRRRARRDRVPYRKEQRVDAVTDNLDLFWSGFLRSLGICLWGMVGSLAARHGDRGLPGLPGRRRCAGSARRGSP